MNEEAYFPGVIQAHGDRGMSAATLFEEMVDGFLKVLGLPPEDAQGELLEIGLKVPKPMITKFQKTGELPFFLRNHANNSLLNLFVVIHEDWLTAILAYAHHADADVQMMMSNDPMTWELVQDRYGDFQPPSLRAIQETYHE